jgi:hypothetical protein
MRIFTVGIFVFASATVMLAQTDPTTLPRLQPGDFDYIGAFRLPAATYGGSSLNYSEGPFALNPPNGSILIVGHSHHQEIAEFTIPALVESDTLTNLNMASPPLQSFSASVLDAVPNSDNINRIGGMSVVPSSMGPRLLVNGYEYYDADGNVSHTTLSVSDPDDISGSTVEGYFSFAGGAGHTSGWISPIPPEWQDTLGGHYITGQSSGIPIISRTSVGPSAFAFDPSQIVDSTTVSNPIPTIRLLDFSLAHPLASDLSNTSGSNNLWTHLSRVTYGIILPGTRTYATFGYSGGHGPDGVCYKCTQDNGNTCGGYCAPDHQDYYQFLWLWDVNDLLAVKSGSINPYDVTPYWYGAFPTPFENGTHEIGGGAFDPNTGYLYLTIQKGDREQGTYSNPPVVVVYQAVAPDSVSSAVKVNLRIVLEGAYDSSGDSMSTAVNASLPLSQPFGSAEFDATPLEFDSTVAVSTMPSDAVGWVVVGLRTGHPDSTTMSEVARTVGLLKSNGTIVNPDNLGAVEFEDMSAGEYFVTVHHRNHLGAMSRNPVALGLTAASFDFSADSTRAFGSNAMREMSPGVWAFYAGDANLDGHITASDFNEWLTQTRVGAGGFQSADFDLNAVVNAADFNLWLTNTKCVARSQIP